jgi:uncharacterized protein YndB with AHSA1/START domain
MFDAPREQVFRAWTDPGALAAWYGPDHVEVPHDRVHIDLRVGGRFELTMLGPDGSEFTLRYEIVDVAEPELLVLRSEPLAGTGMTEPTVLRVELHDHGARTRMTLSEGPFPPPIRHGAEQGYAAALAKLARLLTDR